MTSRLVFRKAVYLLAACWLSVALAWAGTAKQVENLIQAARAQVGVTTGYDPSYQRIAYPGGDVDSTSGVCTDVLIRALRALKLDLQVNVHEDMRANFARYPRIWGLKRPDRHIDHRRVPNLQTFFKRHGWQVSASAASAEHRDSEIKPGDILTWMLPGNAPHIGIVSDRRDRLKQRFLIIHNIGVGTQEDDLLSLALPQTGHYRLPALR